MASPFSQPHSLEPKVKLGRDDVVAERFSRSSEAMDGEEMMIMV